MPQSNFIFAAILIAAIVFVTIRGSLPIYISVFSGAKKAPEPETPPATMMDGLKKFLQYKAKT